MHRTVETTHEFLLKKVKRRNSPQLKERNQKKTSLKCHGTFGSGFLEKHQNRDLKGVENTTPLFLVSPKPGGGSFLVAIWSNSRGVYGLPWVSSVSSDYSTTREVVGYTCVTMFLFHLCLVCRKQFGKKKYIFPSVSCLQSEGGHSCAPGTATPANTKSLKRSLLLYIIYW